MAWANNLGLSRGLDSMSLGCLIASPLMIVFISANLARSSGIRTVHVPIRKDQYNHVRSTSYSSVAFLWVNATNCHLNHSEICFFDHTQAHTLVQPYRSMRVSACVCVSLLCVRSNMCRFQSHNTSHSCDAAAFKASSESGSSSLLPTSILVSAALNSVVSHHESNRT